MCDVIAEGQLAGHWPRWYFDGDRAFLMPNGEVAGPDQRRPRGAARRRRAAPRSAGEPPWRRSEDRGLHLPMGDGLLGRVVDSTAKPLDRDGPSTACAPRTDAAPPHQRDGPRPGAPAAGHRRARHQHAADRRPASAWACSPAPAWASRAAGHDGALHRRRRHRRRPDRRTRAREVKEFIEDIPATRGRPFAWWWRHRPTRRRWCVCRAPLRHGHRRALPRPGKHVLLLMDSLTRYVTAQREIALAIGEPPATKGLPAELFASCRSWWNAAATACNGVGSITAFYTVLERRRRPAGPDRRRPPRHPRRPHRAVARPGRIGALSGHRRRTLDLARDDGGGPAASTRRAARRCASCCRAYNKGARPHPAGAYMPGHDAELDLAVKLPADPGPAAAGTCTPPLPGASAPTGTADRDGGAGRQPEPDPPEPG